MSPALGRESAVKAVMRDLPCGAEDFDLLPASLSKRRRRRDSDETLHLTTHLHDNTTYQTRHTTRRQLCFLAIFTLSLPQPSTRYAFSTKPCSAAPRQPPAVPAYCVTQRLHTPAYIQLTTTYRFEPQRTSTDRHAQRHPQPWIPCATSPPHFLRLAAATSRLTSYYQTSRQPPSQSQTSTRPPQLRMPALEMQATRMPWTICWFSLTRRTSA